MFVIKRSLAVGPPFAAKHPGTLVLACFREDFSMATCEVCGNDYAKAFTVTLGGRKHTFDSFECAIHALAPTCTHCGCKVIGHGVENDGAIFCCAHCVEHQNAVVVSHAG